MSQPEQHGNPVSVLLAEDDQDDRELVRDALHDAGLANPIKFVVDGQDLMDYLRRDGRYADGSVDAPRPGIILLDLKMPKKDGREALAEIKADLTLRRIPVVVLTTSKDEQDVLRSYELGASSFITKPVTFAALVEAMRTWTRYWFELVEIPQRWGWRSPRAVSRTTRDSGRAGQPRSRADEVGPRRRVRVGRGSVMRGWSGEQLLLCEQYGAETAQRDAGAAFGTVPPE